jgi:uncharacterized protein (DUF1800 family)
MDKNTLWSLRLGFSAKQSEKIEKIGFKKFLSNSFNTNIASATPAFLEGSPKTYKEFQEIRKKTKSNPEQTKEINKKETQTSFELKAWWIDKMREEEYPLREKMTCFWHNHYVSTYQKVKVNYWIFKHNQILRENAFGNFKTLTKEIVQSNAMIRYLDNGENRKNKLNENLSRELLELFTLGIGNYSEEDIKNGAKGLAGLEVGAEKAVYRKFLQNDDSFVYLGKKGDFKIDEMIDIIFEQPNVPYLITRKILKWFIYDNPKEELVTYYGDYFRKMNFEIQPLLFKIFSEEFAKNNAGSKIKNPLEFSLQLLDELNYETPNSKVIAYFIKQQGMDLFNQTNVKGWDGGNSWLTSQVFLQRHNAIDLLCKGKNFTQGRKYNDQNSMMKQNSDKEASVKLNWNKDGNNTAIIAELSNRLLFQNDPNNQADFEQILKYDFDSKTEGSENAVMRLFNFMVKTPEFQLI